MASMFLVAVLLSLCHISSGADDMTTVKVALKQQNLDKLEALFWEVSDPRSDKYAKYMTPHEIKALVAPSTDSIIATRSWLASLGAEQVTLSATGDFVSASVPRSVLPLLADDLVPRSHVDFVVHTGTPSFRMETGQVNRSAAPWRKLRAPNASPLGTPANQKSAYGIPADLVCTNPGNQQMVWGTGTYGYAPSDLALYEKTFKLDNDLDNIQTQGYPGTVGGDNFGEGTLDITLITALAPGAPSIVANTDNGTTTEYGVGFGPAFLDFVSELSGAEKVPYVLSFSLGSLSWDSCNLLCTALANNTGGSTSYAECYDYAQSQRQVCMYPSSDQIDRINTEFMKLGLRGSTLVAASGDGGSHFSFMRFPTDDAIGQGLNEVSCEYNLPTFPSDSPYLLSIGGTEWSKGMNTPIYWSAGGSGYSWRSPMPEYQKAEVMQYMLDNAAKMPPASSFNASNRAYPDVAALADNVPMAFGGKITVAGGTSASAPEFGAIVTLLNDHRLNLGLPPLGFINTRLYQMNREHSGELFYDMTEGDSSCDVQGFCCDNGFPSAKGWDATTGMGSPIWAGLYKYMALD